MLAESGRLGVIMSKIVFWLCVVFLLCSCHGTRSVTAVGDVRNDSLFSSSHHFERVLDSVFIREVIRDTIKGDTLIRSHSVFVNRGKLVRVTDTINVHHYNTIYKTITKTTHDKPTFKEKFVWGCYGVVFICLFLALLIIGRNVVRNVRRILGKE